MVRLGHPVFSRLAARLGLARLVRAVPALAVTAVMLGAGLATLVLAPLGTFDPDGTGSGGDRLLQLDDADQDGLEDSLENRLGSDPQLPSTLGQVGDGWLHHWYGDAIDWNDTGILSAAVLVAPQEELPPALQAPGSISYPTLEELYLFEEDRRSHLGPTWWTSGSALDPRQWDGDRDGIADAWFLMHAIDPLSADPDSPAPGDPTLTLREKYERGLDPLAADSDRDGLSDAQEMAGLFRRGGTEIRFQPTGPAQASTAGHGIVDGYLVAHGLDPHDPDLADATPAGDGITVAEAFAVSSQACGKTPPCDWSTFLHEGTFIDPTAWDSLGDGVPDAWAIRDPNGRVDPLADASTLVVSSSEDWDASPWDGNPGDLSGVVIDDENPAPSGAAIVTAKDAYTYGRPGDWSESEDGPWWNGLPTAFDADAGGLPPAVALRGWNLTVDTSLGIPEGDEVPEELLERRWATADPRNNDTDGDSLSDLAEYYGIQPDGSVGIRTDPSDPDTDGDGLDDLLEITEAGTHPLRRDTSGDFLTDGQSFEYWESRYQEALHDAATMSTMELEDAYGWLVRDGDGTFTASLLERLRPTGSLTGDEPNILGRDADGDGILNGAELFPDRFLNIPTDKDLPATDPARADSDGDGLPDAWEISWISDEVFKCRQRCDYDGEVPGWPLDPSKRVSVIDISEPASDAEVNLAGDDVRIDSTGRVRMFSSGLAYQYGLDPYAKDTSGDGLGDMFEIHWGADTESLPDWVIDEIEDSPGEYAWAFGIATRTARGMLDRGVEATAPAIMVFDPASSEAGLAPEDNAMEAFTDRAKGTWVIADADEGCVDRLPAQADDPRRHEEAYQTPGATVHADRAGLRAECWEWIEWSVRDDYENRTSPFSHDFDADGIPDAWEFHYGVQQRSAAGPSPGSLASGCLDKTQQAGLPPLDALGKDSYCLDLLASYRLGVDPTRGDSDGGGLPDWKEVALGLDPLDISDDQQGEDWDGDGVLNGVEDAIGTSRFSPDSDGDGLLDGDMLGLDTPAYLQPDKGGGDLCVRGGTDLVPGMEFRPFMEGLGEGPVTHDELLEWLLQHGILVDDPGSACDGMPTHTEGGKEFPYLLLRREGSLDVSVEPPEVRGSGGGSDSTEWDTNGDGIPDGWLVYWAFRSSGANIFLEQLDPTREGGTGHLDPDRDGPTFEEYTLNRPAWWEEETHGPWWGGSDPTRPDTDGDAPWYESTFAAADPSDLDNDNDGIPDAIDPAPGIDPGNAGFLRENTPATQAPLVWSLLEQRRLGPQDRDGDLVPDMLDRAAVRFEDVQFDSLEFSKGGPERTASGVLVVDDERLDVEYEGEPEGPDVDGWAVANAAIKVIVSDGQRRSVVGYGFTQDDGSFQVPFQIGSTVTGPPAPVQGFVAGHAVDEGGSLTLQGDALSLAPGPVEVWLEAEPNDEAGHPLLFGGGSAPSIAVHKDLDDAEGQATEYRAPAHTPGSPGAELVALRADADGAPDETVRHLRHQTGAIFGTHSPPHDGVLRSTAVLTAEVTAGRPRVGEPLEVQGTLDDADGVALVGDDIHVFVRRGGDPIAQQSDQTDPAGLFSISFDTQTWATGAYEVTVEAEVQDEGGFLQAPEPITIAPVVLAQDTRWEPTIEVGDALVSLPGGRGSIDPAVATPVQATLLDDATGEPVSRSVDITLSSLSGGQVPVDEQVVSDAAGRVSFDIGPLPADTPLDLLRLRMTPEKVTPADAAPGTEVFLRPSFATEVTAEDVVARLGQEHALEARLHRTTPLGSAVTSTQEGSFLFEDPDGAVTRVDGTDGEGIAHLALHPDAPGVGAWRVRFLGSPPEFLGASPWTTFEVTTTGGTRILLDPTTGLRDEPVESTGRLVLENGSAIPDATVEVGWSDDDALEATTASDGSFSVPLPARAEAGGFQVDARFLGDVIHRPSTASQSVVVQRPVEIHLHALPITVDPSGTMRGGIQARLLDDRGEALASRPVQFTLEGPGGGSRELERVTAADGGFEWIGRSDVPETPGRWNVTAGYAGAHLETAARNATNVSVIHEARLEITRSPSVLHPHTPSTVGGRLVAPSIVRDVTRLDATLAGRAIGEADAHGDRWEISIQPPLLPAGRHTLQIQASTPFYRIEPVLLPINVTSDISASIEEDLRPGGGRDVTIQLTYLNGTGVAARDVVLTRTHRDGTLLQVHRLTTDDEGIIRLSLDADAQGSLGIASVDDPDLRLATVEKAASLRPPPPSSGLSGTAVAVSAALIAGGVVVWVLFRRWQRRQGEGLTYVFKELASGVAGDDAAGAVRRAYTRMLRHLVKMGYRHEPNQTVRDIAAAAVRAFRLPRDPMSELTQLFEVATYGTRRLGEADRRVAAGAASAIMHHVERPEDGP